MHRAWHAPVSLVACAALLAIAGCGSGAPAPSATTQRTTTPGSAATPPWLPPTAHRVGPIGKLLPDPPDGTLVFTGGDAAGSPQDAPANLTYYPDGRALVSWEGRPRGDPPPLPGPFAVPGLDGSLGTSHAVPWTAVAGPQLD